MSRYSPYGSSLSMDMTAPMPSNKDVKRARVKQHYPRGASGTPHKTYAYTALEAVLGNMVQRTRDALGLDSKTTTSSGRVKLNHKG
jgi:hypothetical protein